MSSADEMKYITECLSVIKKLEKENALLKSVVEAIEKINDYNFEIRHPGWCGVNYDSDYDDGECTCAIGEYLAAFKTWRESR